MAKAKIIKTSKSTGYRLGEIEDNLVVIEGVKFVKHKSTNLKARQLKEIQFGCFEDSTISRFNNIQIELAPLIKRQQNHVLSVLYHALRILFYRSIYKKNDV